MHGSGAHSLKVMLDLNQRYRREAQEYHAY